MSKIFPKEFSDEEILLAIVNKDIIFHFQPIVDRNEEIIVYETLTRLNIKNKIVYPEEFLWIFEKVPLPSFYECLIEKVYSLLLNESFTKKISINISKHEVDNGFFAFLIEKNLKTPIDPKRLIIEITEGTLLDINSLRKVSKIRQEHGFLFAIDDFGVKYATLSHLYQNEDFFDIIKLDGMFLEDVDKIPSRKEGLYHIRKLCHAFGKKTVIEYVDSEYKKQLSLDAGYDYMQGYLFGKPMIIESYEDLMKYNHRTA